MAIPDAVWAFGREVAERLSSVLGDGLVGAYFVGSVALGGYVAGESDVDIAAVCRSSLDHQARQAVAESVETTLGSCPARGLEFSLYRSEVAASSAGGADFEVNVNGGPRMERKVRLAAEGQRAFWYVLDRAVAHRCGVTIDGPPPAGVFADTGRPELLAAMAESMQWHRVHEQASLYSVLNAARAWRFAVEDELGSKLEGAAWARERWHQPSVIDAAVALRHGRPAHLDTATVAELLDHVQHVLVASTGGMLPRAP